MITKKEDLHDTQIFGDGALEYQRLAFEFGIGWNELGTDLNLRPNYAGVTCKKYGSRYELATIRELSSDKEIKTLTKKDLIPQTKEVEWANGDVVNTPDGEGCIVAEVYRDGCSYWIVQFEDYFHPFDTGEISKPETEAERVEREREEFKVEICKDLGIGAAGCNTACIINKLYELGYRKKSE